MKKIISALVLSALSAGLMITPLTASDLNEPAKCQHDGETCLGYALSEEESAEFLNSPEAEYIRNLIDLSAQFDPANFDFAPELANAHLTGEFLNFVEICSESDLAGLYAKFSCAWCSDTILINALNS